MGFDEVMEMVFQRPTNREKAPGKPPMDYSRVGGGWRGPEYAAAEKRAAETSEMREGFKNRRGGGQTAPGASFGGGRSRGGVSTQGALWAEQDRLRKMEEEKKRQMQIQMQQQRQQQSRPGYIPQSSGY